MSIKPILFNTDMVRAILDGRKAVTRRVVKPQPKHNVYLWKLGECRWSDVISVIHPMPGHSLWNRMPCQPGDVLYVRETWNKCGNGYRYKEDWEKDDIADIVKWRPSIHMPKEAARIWLKVTDVRVERLRDITDEQAQAEGIREYTKDGNLYKYAVTDDWWSEYHRKHQKEFNGTYWQDMPRTAKEAFSYLWNSTIKKSDLARYGWGENPWVWVIEFECCEKPEES